MDELHVLPGRVPRPGEVTVGCRFAARCAHVMARCTSEAPELVQIAPGHSARCHLFTEPSAATDAAHAMVEEATR